MLLRLIPVFTLFLASHSLSIGQKPNMILTDLVNPFVGTGGHGHTFPGATLPFGMVQASPDTRLTGWDGCSGYHYSDTVLYGFSQTHLSGTGVSDYGDILLMPAVGQIRLNNGADGQPGYGAVFSKKTETASPGYYRCIIKESGIKAEVTVTERTALYRFTFPEEISSHLVMDLDHRDSVLKAEAELSPDGTISGYRISNAWAREQHVYFHMRFSRPIETEKIKRSNNERVWGIPFELGKDRVLLVKVAISPVDIVGARANLEKEMPYWDFEMVRDKARQTWEEALGKITITSRNDSARRIFYTGMYHSMIAPNIYQDIDGRYRGMDLGIHQNDTTTRYTVFSLWDTYRATHPLLAYLEPGRSLDFIRSFLGQYKEGGIIPIWELAANYTGCMIGYHSIPVIYDLWAKGLRRFNADQVLNAMIHSATRDNLGLESYKNLGFVSAKQEPESVSKTLEYAFDDWCIAEMARELGRDSLADVFYKRSRGYQHLFDPATGFFRARTSSSLIEPFDPAEVNFHFTEANAWQYNFYVPHDIDGLIRLHGGAEQLERKLDSLFLADPATKGRIQPDISGMIGQYAHGNEPSHHIAFLYNFVGAPQKTQHYVREIIRRFYQDRPDGLAGNEDCGQMSSWYVFSSMGLYPVTPGSNTLALTTPLFERSQLHLNDGKAFTINCEGCDEGKKYISSVLLNGKPYDKTYITHDQIMAGSTLDITASNKPTTWGSAMESWMRTSIKTAGSLARPFFRVNHNVFRDTLSISPGHSDPQASFYYQEFGNGKKFIPFSEKIVLDHSATLKMYAQLPDGTVSDTIVREFRKIPANWKINLSSKYANQYSAGGDLALIDGVMGGMDFRTGAWQGFQGVDFEAVIDLGDTRSVSLVSLNCLQDQRSWILFPASVTVFTSIDCKNFEELGTVNNDISAHHEGPIRKEFGIKTPIETRFVRVVARSQGELPEWHPGAGGDSWIFVDELKIISE